VILLSSETSIEQSLADQLTLNTLPRIKLSDRGQQAAGVGWRAQQIGGFLQRFVIVE
jgi:hypothetical protein